MRIGFDMLAVQSPHHGARGIGRYSASLLTSMMAKGDEHEYVLYVHDDLPVERIPTTSQAEIRTIRPNWEQGEVMSPFMDRLARSNPDELDAFVVLSPFEMWASYTPPSHPIVGPKMVAVVYDLIPFLFQNDMHVDPELMRHYHVLEKLTRYDALLAISEATRRDVLSLLRLSPDRVVNVSGASNPAYFKPDRSTPMTRAARNTFAELGIYRPYIMNVGGLDPRKNTYKLMDAFAELPAKIRETHQLVLTFMINDWGREAVLEHARRLNLEESIVLTGEVTDETLLRLYQRCEAFVMPSMYEGFGLPLLEAMHCGAVVIGGNNSSQVEVIGDAGLLAEASDTHDIAAKITLALENPAMADSLRAKAIERAAGFSWERTATQALETITQLENQRRVTTRHRFDRGHSRKPNIAFFSPLPPRKSGVSDYSLFLLGELRKHYRIDLIHDAGYVPEPALASSEYVSCDHRVFDRMASAKDYHAIVYQMGNSRYHNYMYPIMLRHPGVVTLHDFALAGFHLNYGHFQGMGKNFLYNELRASYPEQLEAINKAIDEWPACWDDIVRDCTRRGWFLNRRVLDAAESMVVHSPWCERMVQQTSPKHVDKVIVIPFGIHPRRMSDDQRRAVRARFSLPEDALIIASFGFVHPDKMSPEALDAFVTIADEDPTALFVFVGEEADDGHIRRHVMSLGIMDRVRFLGRQPADDYADLIGVTDVGVNLRLPPTNGETSAALLNLLAMGVPTVVTDVATFSDYPSSVVRKVRWETEGPDGLFRAMHGLTSSPEARESLGRSALSYVEQHHEWSHVCQFYVDAIERCHEAQNVRRAKRHVGRKFPALERVEHPSATHGARG